MSKTRIEWADRVWNPVTGCSKVSAGCANCYAEGVAKRFWGARKFGEVVCHDDRLEQPLSWRKPQRVFVNSMSDLFHEDVPAPFITSVFAAMARARHHTFMILTKRPGLAKEKLECWAQSGLTLREGCGSTLPNVWLGVTVENQQTADERIPILMQTPAAVRFVSCEPMLGPVDFTNIRDPHLLRHDVLRGNDIDKDDELRYTDGHPSLDWIICGGESGPGARPMHPGWVRALRDQCRDTNTPFFFKQWGEWAPGHSTGSECEHYRNCYRLASNSELVVMDSESHIRRHSFDSTDQHSGDVCAWRIGKKAAGNELDGQVWGQFPGVSP